MQYDSTEKQDQSARIDIAENRTVRILFGGDVNFDSGERLSRSIGVYVKKNNKNSSVSLFWKRLRRKIRRVFLYRIFPTMRQADHWRDLFSRELLIKTPENKALAELRSRDRSVMLLDFSQPDPLAGFDYPFEKISKLLKSKDLVVVNLETPLADESARVLGLFRSHPGYARAMADAGIGMVNLANNHIFDALEVGLSQTVKHLNEAGILYTGYGKNLQQARLGKTIELKGIKYVFLGYTQYCNTRYASIATPEYAGVLPLDAELIIEDILRVKETNCFVFVILHWGIEDQHNIQERLIELAHQFVDAGADAIIGHHPHVPHGIEVYKGRPIVYSLGNCIFGRYEKAWSDNFMAEVVMSETGIQEIVIYPISGKGRALCQPGLLEGESAKSLLDYLARKSARFKTKIDIADGVGRIRVREHR